MSQQPTQPDNQGAVDPTLPPDPKRRFWVATACTLGGAVGVGTAVPFVASFAPSDKARAAGAPVTADISDLAMGQMKVVEWRGKPVWIVRRSKVTLEDLPKHDAELADPDSDRPGFTPPWAKNEWRSRDPEYFICIGICTHLGCSPTAYFQTGAQPGLPTGWPGGWLCACHGSTFDLAGRVFANKPAPDNLEIPPYVFSADGTKVTIGVEEDNKA
ncbi:ubiquinol-cytochrome c reductase iron-sulfur subunit [Castellaniella sp.]|uniref:ubiquinol-cytochrome c reductase iron-sulfur subunit n=1 Tax=Castellaniella sp. TaxID=1955812 RepID=UPI00356A3A94